MGKNTIVHKCKLWSMCLVIMCGILFFLTDSTDGGFIKESLVSKN